MTLRSRAEALLNARQTTDLSPKESDELIYELQTHQVELELQNEELRAAQVELASARDRYADLYDFAPVGYVTTFGQGIILEVNLTFTEMVKTQRRFLIRQPLSAWVVAEDQDIYYLHRRALVEPGQRGSCELRLRRQGDDPLWVRMGSVAQAAEEGEVHLRSIFEDLTTSREAKEQQHRLEDRLRQAERMQSLGVMAGGIAHDFNNMLAAIVGNGELAQMTLDPDSKAAPHVDQVLVAAERSAALVRQILTFSRHIEQDIAIVNLAAAVAETIDILRPSLPVTIAIRQEIVQAPNVLADPTQIEQVILNLCTNASHAMQQSGGTLTLSLATRQVTAAQAAGQPGAREGEYAHLAVADTGGGIAPEILSRVFEPFFTTKPVGKGTGMGLAICHGIIAAQGGFFSVESELGVGSVFHVYLPVTEEAAPGKPLPQPTEEVRRGHERVLVVEEEESLRAVLSKMLEADGYHATLYSGSADALAAVRQSPDAWDLLLTDQAMSGMDGVELLRAVRVLRGDLPVVIMTGYSEQLSDADDGGVGAAGVLRKPFRGSVLAMMLRRVLDG